MTEDRVQSKSATLVVCYGLDQIKRDYPEDAVVAPATRPA